MANQSIYSNEWIDLVFENRNKEYGAYQLRQENPKTTLKALLTGLMLILIIAFIPYLLNQFGTKPSDRLQDIPLSTPLEISSVIFSTEKKPQQQAVAPITKKKNNEPKTKVDRSNLVNPTITEAQNATTVIATNEQTQANVTEAASGALVGSETEGVEGGTGIEGNGDSNELNPNNRTTYVPTVLDKQPMFPGGMSKFYTYISRNFKTPDTELSREIKVYVSFVIEKDGSMTDIKVPRNPGYGLDKEAIRILKNLKTKWEPGILHGKPVRTAYNLPIVVQQK